MNVQFKVIRRCGDKAYILSEITGYDECLPVVLTASTEEGLRIPSDTFPYCDVDDSTAVCDVIYDGALANHETQLPPLHTKNSAGVRFFVVVLPWLSSKRWELEFRAVDSQGNFVTSCHKSLDIERAKWTSRVGMKTNPTVGNAIQQLDDRFIHDRIRSRFIRAQRMDNQVLVTALVEMPYHEESVIEFDFLDGKGHPLALEPRIIEDSVNHASDFGSFERRSMEVSVLLPEKVNSVCLCATDTVGNIVPGFSMLTELGLTDLLATFDKSTTSAYRDPLYHQWYKTKHQADVPTLLEQVSSRFAHAPLISIVCPIYQTPVHHIHDLVTCLNTQSYGRWELILVDIGDTVTQDIVDIVDSIEGDRIYLITVDQSLSLGDKINVGISAVEGEYVGLMRASDSLSPDALFEYVRIINEFPDCDVAYCDSDTIDAEGVHSHPIFRPDFSPELLRSCNYMRDFLMIRTDFLIEVGPLNGDFTGALDYELVLRATEKARRVCHVRRVLYHRRYAVETANAALFSEFEQEAGRKALVEHCRRVGIEAEVLNSSIPFHYRVRHVLIESPHVVIVVPTKDNPDLLLSCVRSLYSKIAYRNFEVVVVDVQSANPETFELYKTLENRYPTLSVKSWNHDFNYAAIANFVARLTEGEYLFFINDDTKVLVDDLLETMLGYFQQDNVGVVGGQQLFSDGTIEHAGLALGKNKVVNPLSRYMASDWQGYLKRTAIAQNVTAVTGECMMVRRSVFDEVGGFTEEFTIAYSDIDFCLKARELGYYTVYTPYARLSHYSGVSRVRIFSKEMRIKVNREAALLQYLWPRDFVEGDAFYNTNLDPDSPYYALACAEDK